MTLATIRRPSRASARFLFAAALAVGLGASAFAADWPQYRGPKHDGVSTEDISKGWSGNAAPKQLWKVPIGEGFGTFAVAGDAAYVFVNRNAQETLLALDANSGKERWATPVGASINDTSGGSNPRSTPTVDGDHVYVFSVNLKLVCMTTKDGKVVWEKDLLRDGGGKNIGWGSAASPVLEGDRIFVGCGAPGKSMVAFDKATGNVLWAAGNEQITHASPTPATIAGVPQVVFFMQSGLVSLRQEDGKELWRAKFPYNTSTAASPIVGGKNGDVVYCSAGYGVGSGAFRVTKQGENFSARQLWFKADSNKGRASHFVNHWSTPVYSDGYLYGIFGFKEFSQPNKPVGGPLTCVDIETGDVAWAQPGFGSGGGTTLAGKYVLAQGDAGLLALVEATPKGFNTRAHTQLPGEKFWSAAIVADGKIYARNKTEGFCFDVSGGK